MKLNFFQPVILLVVIGLTVSTPIYTIYIEDESSNEDDQEAEPGVILYKHDKFKGRHLRQRDTRTGSFYILDNFGFNDITSKYILKRIH